MSKFKWDIEEVVETDNTTISIGSGEIDLQDLEVSQTERLEIEEVDETDVTLSAIPSGTVEKLEVSKREVNNDDKQFNQKMVESLFELFWIVIITMLVIFVVVAVKDILKGDLSLEKYVSQVTIFMGVLATFLGGMGFVNYFSGKSKTDTG